MRRTALPPFALTGLALVLAGCAASSTPAAGPPPMVASGEPRSCVLLSQIDGSTVHDDRTIDFRLRGGQVLRNTLPYSCPGLGFARAFSYQTSISQLCHVDTITVIEQGGGPRRGASCGLGMFVPVRTAETPPAEGRAN